MASDQRFSFSPDGSRVAIITDTNPANDDGSKKSISFVLQRIDADSLWPSVVHRLAVDADSAQGIAVWNTGTGEQVLRVSGFFTRVCFSPDGAQLGVATQNIARVLDSRTGREMALLEGHEDLIEAIAYGRSGRQLVTGSRDRTARVWNSTTGAQELVLSGHDDMVTEAAFSPDESRIMTLTDSGMAQLFDALTADRLLDIQGLPASLLMDEIVFSPDGSRVIVSSGDRAVVLESLPRGVRAGMSLQASVAAGQPLGRGSAVQLRGESDEDREQSLRKESTLPSSKKGTKPSAERRDAYQASQWVCDLQDKLLFPDAILAEIDASVAMPLPIKERAVALTRLLWVDPARYDQFARSVVLKNDKSSEEYAAALRASRVAVSERPEPKYLSTHGAAEYRNGRFLEAIRSFQQSSAASETGEPDPPSLAFLSMAQFRAGLSVAAIESLARLKEQMRVPRYSGNPQYRALLREAIDLIESETTGH